MQSFKSILLSLALVASAPAFASCEDGESIAYDAVLNKEKATIYRARGNCSISVGEAKATRNGERYEVVISCNDQLRTVRIYEVNLREIEDAVCVLQSAREVGSNG